MHCREPDDHAILQACSNGGAVRDVVCRNRRDLLIALAAQDAPASADAVHVRVQADKSDGPLRPIWNYWGYDEPNYTYAPNGKKLLRELAALSPEPVYIRDA